MKKVAILFIVLLTSSFVFAQNTYVPDDKFEQALIDLGYDTTLDNYVLTANISGVTTLDVANKEISDLTGIEAFTALTYLNCNSNKLTNLDVSANTALTELFCYENQLTSLDVSANTALTKLSCSDNQLTSLDVSSNTALIWLFPYANQLTNIDITNNTILTEFDVSSNQLTSLDVSKNTALIELNVNSNQLTSLDVTKNTALENLYACCNKLTSLDVSKNTALITLDPDQNQLTSLDVSNNIALTRINCGGNKLTSLDVSKNTALEKLFFYDNKLTSLDLSKNTALLNIEGWDNALASLDVSNNTALIELNVNNNSLTSLDVSKNTALTKLTINQNQLTSLDVSKNTTLETLHACCNKLTSLDVSRNTALANLNCNDNQLTSLNIRNGVTDAWSAHDWSGFNATNNPNLTCIEVLDPAWATANWTSAKENIDAGVTFSVICGGTDLTTWHVATTGSDVSGSGTLASPLATIQTGVNAATEGDTVLVASGTYVENLNINKNIILSSTSGPENTIIDGNQNGRVIKLDGSVSSDIDMKIIGFSIQNGNTSEHQGGGGIYLRNRSTIIENCFIMNNSTSSPSMGGGGLSIAGDGDTEVRVIIKSSLIANNTSEVWSTGGMEPDGGGWASAIWIPDMRNASDSISIINTSFSGNQGEVLVSFGNSYYSFTLKNSIIWDNGNTRLGLPTQPYDSRIIVSFSNIQGGYEGEGNIDANPLFCDYASNVFPNLKGDYHLMPSSPSVGTGENGVNMGALGVGCEIDRLETLSEFVPDNDFLHENYPNPFNPTTTLRFDLPEVSSITLTIYNMLGQKVRTFNMNDTPAGYHSVTWDATNDLGQQVGAGVYLYQLQTKDFVKTRKMVLLK